MLLRCVGRIDKEISLSLSGLFSQCQTTKNRQAIIRGLVRFILSRGFRTSVRLVDSVNLNDTDAVEILLEAEQWRADHPDEKLSLRTLQISPDEGSAIAVLALLQVLEDAEEVSLSSLSDVFLSRHVENVLRFPSLRRLTVENLILRDMDLFISKAGDNPQLCLETLQLSGLTLGESASMTQFIESLDPHGVAPSTLSRTLQSLCIAETDPTVPRNDDDDDDDVHFDDRPKVRLAINDPDALTMLDRVLESNTTLRYVNFLGDFTIRPVMRAYEKFPHPAQISSMPVPPTLLRGSAIAQTRKLAFISAVYGGGCASARCLDSNIISIVLGFSGSYIERRVRV